MASESRSWNEEDVSVEEEEAIKIAVLSVHKKGSILKRIFLNFPPPPPMAPGPNPRDRGGGRGGEKDDGRPILFGRHPDCHVVVDHPSISRFHLAVRLVPSLQKLSVTDLSSVHGTWVSGTKIPPNSAVDMVDGETLRLGASTRVYLLQWVSSSRVHEMENPLEPVAEDKGEALQDDSGGLAPDANQPWPIAIPSAPPLPESMNTSPLPSEREPKKPVGKEREVDSSTISAASMVESTAYSLSTVAADSSLEVSSVIKEPAEPAEECPSLDNAGKRSSPSSLLPTENSRHSTDLVKSSPLPFEPESPLRKAQEVESPSSVFAVPMGDPIAYSMPTVVEDYSGPQVTFVLKQQTEQEYLNPESAEKRSSPSSLSLVNSSALPSEQEIPTRKAQEVESSSSISAALIRESIRSSMLTMIEESSSQVLSALREPPQQESLSPVRSEKRRDTPSSLLSRRSKSKSVGFLRVDTGRTKEKNVASSRPDIETQQDVEKENSHTCEAKREEKLCRVLFESFDDVGGQEKYREESFESDKENMTPISSCQKIKRSSSVLLKSVCVREPSNVEVFKSLTKRRVVAERNVSGSDREIFKLGISAAKNRQEVTQQLDCSSSAASSVSEEYVLHVDKVNWMSDSCKNLESRETTNGLLAKVEDNVAATSAPEDALYINKGSWRPDYCNDVNPVMSEIVAKFEDNGTTPSVSEAVLNIDKENFTLTEVDDSVVAASSLLENVLHIDKENRKPDSNKDVKSRKVMNGTIVNADIEDTFASDKENSTPQVSRSLKSKAFLIPSNSRERIEKEIMKKKTERIPFQALLEIPPKTNFASAIDQEKSSKSNCALVKDNIFTTCSPNRSSRSSTEESAATWNIVVDANCFLDEESRKSLHLLEGLKRTHLIIPRIVIRELDCLKKRESFFSKSTKMASKALQWIEECMINKSWWIHVQSSFETLPVAPTPPISPRSPPYADLSINSKSFSTYGSLTDIVSPTAEDHILDCALLFKKIKAGAKFILLSNSVALKIKAMAEGLLCETPKEFRESLVNPFSKRFLWADSSPRGSTWSCSNTMMNSFDDYLLPHQPARKIGKAAEAAKGLKLILLHNSQYAQINSNK